MRSSFRLAAIIAAISLSGSTLAATSRKAQGGCPEGQTPVQGKCVPACATTGAFATPEACECPAGYGKILKGDGGGECAPILCPSNAPFESGRACQCAHNFARSKPRKGMVTCVLAEATPKKARR